MESPSLEIFKTWLFSSVSCSSWTCFGLGQGWCDLKNLFLTSTIVWNHEQVPFPTASSMNSRDSWFLPLCSTTPNLFLGFIHNLLFLPHKNILPYTFSHTLHSSIPVNLQHPKPKSLGLFLGPLSPPSANFVHHKGNFLPYLVWAQSKLSSHLEWCSPTLCPTWSNLHHHRKRKESCRELRFDTDWKTSSIFNMSEELTCLCLAAAEHPKIVFIQRFMGCLIIEVLRDGHNRKIISFLFGVSAPKHISTVFQRRVDDPFLMQAKLIISPRFLYGNI